MAKDTTPRWVYRFENFTRAHARLSEATDAMKRGELDQLGQEGMVKRFEYTWDLAWKVLKDYLEHQRLLPEQPNPARVIRAATAAGFIHDGQLWMDALDTRNKTSHEYRQQLFDEVVPRIVADFEPMFSRFARDFQNR